MAAQNPWTNGNDYKSFVDLMTLVKINDNTYESGVPAYSPGGFTRAYGGHAYAQAAWAAAHTVKRGMVLHSITGWFTLIGDTTKPFTYRVDTVREGRGYCQRSVNVTQDPTKGVCFTCICSFKRPEPSFVERSLDFDLWKEYDVVLKGKRYEEWPECPGVDSPFYWDVERGRGFADPFPGLEMRKVDMQAYNTPRQTLHRRQLQFYRVIGDMPTDPNLHACAHLYASDRNGLFPIPNFLAIGNDYHSVASLNHTVAFHVEGEDVAMTSSSSTSSSEQKQHWFCHEIRVDKIGHGRALMCSRLIREDGLHVASCFQDGMVKFPEPGSEDGISSGLEKWKVKGNGKAEKL